MRSQKSEPAGQAGAPACGRLFPQSGHAPSRLAVGTPKAGRRLLLLIAALLALGLKAEAQQFAVDW
jgi:hypothetical protein